MRVDGNISDLFFNTWHHFRPTTDERGKPDGGDYDELEAEAKDFIACLDRLGVATPTVTELIEDFRARV